MAQQSARMPKPGETIAGKYVLERALSAGSMGSVFVAKQLTTDREFALKIISPKLIGDPQAEARFVREAQLAGSLEHPAIIEVYDVGKHEALSYLVMRLLEGESLGSRLTRGAFPPDDAVDLLIDVLDGVGAAHAHSIVHRDLKPDNIFLCRSGPGQQQPKILDFGVSRFLTESTTQRLTRTGALLGTPLYMPPEQLRGDKELDQRADVYALGVILFQMLTGQMPYQADNYADLVLRVLTEKPRSIFDFDPHVPAALDAIIRKAMEKDDALRFATAQEMSDALQAFRQTRKPQAKSTSKTKSGRPIEKRSGVGGSGASVSQRPAAPSRAPSRASIGFATRSGRRTTRIVMAALALSVLLAAWWILRGH